MRFGLVAYPKKPLKIAYSGMSTETRCLKLVQSLLQLAYFVYARSEKPWRGHAYMQARRSHRHTPM